MNIIEKPHLRHKAVNYINYVLNNGKTLSHCMLKNCNLDIGQIVSYMPTVSKVDSLLAKIIQSYLQEKNTNICILEDTTANIDAPCMRHVIDDENTILFGREVYYILSSKATDDQIKKTICYGKSAGHFICLFTSTGNIENILYNKNISKQVFDKLVTGDVKIAIGAYAGKGFLLWNKD